MHRLVDKQSMLVKVATHSQSEVEDSITEEHESGAQPVIFD